MIVGDEPILDDEEIDFPLNPEEIVFFDYLRVWVEGHIFHAVERCARNIFLGFIDGFEDLGHDVTLATCTIVDHIIFTLFPPFAFIPFKVGRVNWIQVESWLLYGLGDHVKETCLPYLDFGDVGLVDTETVAGVEPGVADEANVDVATDALNA
ncbi:hypothetical protein FRX31_033392 [Thalictrum thalictroides]|uniref:Uncharacterized protein n=1 Tax=Thalictrum thalictroides TaxID=46969 RepID=A0A7J6UX06_THATH|nr:hypothetical protein FRX31_033392 [Thalictrum thalictroides]